MGLCGKDEFPMFSKRVVLLSLALICVLALAIGVMVQAQNQGRNSRPGPPDQMRPSMDAMTCPVRLLSPPPAMMMQRLGEELQFTEQQKKQATEMVGALDAKMKQIMGTGSAIRDLIAELKAEPTNPEKVRTLAAQISKQEADVLQAELTMWLKFEEMLTPEQRTKFWQTFPRRGPVGPPPGGPPSAPAPPKAPGS